MAFPWNAEGVEARLTKLWTEDGLSAAKIAVELTAMTGEPLTRNAVIGRISRLGLSGKGNPDRSFGPQEIELPPAAAPEPEPVEVLAEPVVPIPEPEPAPLQASPGVVLTELRIGQCRFLVTPHFASSHLFCAAAVEAPGATYCPEHAAICFDRRTPQERRADHDRAARARAAKEAA